MKNFVISLKSESKRRNHIISEFNARKVKFNFFNAFTPLIAEKEVKKMGLIYNSKTMTSGEVACLMSHVAIWKKIIDENISYACIFEDDIILSSDAGKFLSSTDWINPKINIIKIEKFNKRVLLSNINIESPDSSRQIKQLKSKHYGCAGYILSFSAAKELMDYLLKNPVLIPLDHIVFEKFMPFSTGLIVQVNPAICIQNSVLTSTHDNFPSSLEVERRQRMKKYKKKSVYKFMNEILRVISQIKLKLLGENINFN